MSPGKELGVYLSSRFPATRFIPVEGFLAAAGLAHSPPANLLPWAIAMVQAFIMILLFRLWDDIADLDYDRQAHPERVLCDTRNLNAFLALAGILFVINGILLFWTSGSYLRPTAYFALCIGLLTWYRFRPVTSSPGLLNSYLVLAKYPVIVGLVSSPLTNSDS
jgi:4-hydroxybenzoate polyprenyltransferase